MTPKRSKSVQCHYCLAKFQSFHALKQHQRDAGHLSHRIQCPKCFRIYESFDDHARTIYGPFRWPCKHCEDKMNAETKIPTPKNAQNYVPLSKRKKPKRKPLS